MNIEESVHNHVFRGTLTSGVITISGYEDIYGAGVTTNCLKGMYVLVNSRLTGYVLSNTAWIGDGLTATLGYSSETVSGLVDVAFIFPLGRLAITVAPVLSLTQPKLVIENSYGMTINTQPPLPSEFVHQVMIRVNHDNLIANDFLIKVRGGHYIGEM